MSGVKRAMKAVVSGGLSEAKELQDKQQRKLQQQQEEAARKAEEQARLQAQQDAELEAAQSAAQSGVVVVGDKQGVELAESELTSKKKKKLRGGKQSLSVARSSGSGINI